MSLTLTTAELAQLETATTTLLAPLSYPCVDDWRTASRHAVQRLLGADISGSLLSLPGEPLANADPELAGGAVAYATYFHRLDTGLHVVRREKRLAVFGVHDIYDWTTYKKTEIYADWNRPYRLYDSVAMAYDVAPDRPAASLHFYHEREEGPRFGERGLAILRLLLPAFRAGVHTLVRFNAHRHALATTLDTSGQAVLLADVAGRPVHATPALARLLAAEPGAAEVRAALAAMAGVLAARLRRRRPSDVSAPTDTSAAEAEVVTGRQRYRVRGTYVGGAALAGQAGGGEAFVLETAILLTLAPVRSVALPESAPARWRERFRLTAREAEVARLAAERRSAREIASELHVRYPTARRHLEHVYEKLAVHSRAELRTCLYGAAGDAGPAPSGGPG